MSKQGVISVERRRGGLVAGVRPVHCVLLALPSR